MRFGAWADALLPVMKLQSGGSRIIYRNHRIIRGDIRFRDALSFDTAFPKNAGLIK